MGTKSRTRRTKAHLGDLLEACLTVLGEYNCRISIRHLYYRLSMGGWIEKTEAAYNNLRALLVKWRRAGSIDMDAFVDATRWYKGTGGSEDALDILQSLPSAYKLNLWQTQNVFVEVWVEKEAIAAIVAPIANEWTLQTFVCRGDPSISSMASAAATFRNKIKRGREVKIIYLGDYDETGLDIPVKIVRNFREDHGVEVELTRAAVTAEQIEHLDLPTRPPKMTKRGPSVDFAVEVDAMSPGQIRESVEWEIRMLVDQDELDRLRRIEEAERETLASLPRLCRESVHRIWSAEGYEFPAGEGEA